MNIWRTLDPSTHIDTNLKNMNREIEKADEFDVVGYLSVDDYGTLEQILGSRIMFVQCGNQMGIKLSTSDYSTFTFDRNLNSGRVRFEFQKKLKLI